MLYIGAFHALVYTKHIGWSKFMNMKKTFKKTAALFLGLALTVGYTQKTLALADGKWAKVLSNSLYIGCVGLLVTSMLFYCVCI
jgi:hypothetical protein